jgi:hypothetical protein
MLGALALVSGVCLGSTGCDGAFLAQPDRSFGSARVALDLLAGVSAGGLPQAFDKADAVWVRVRQEAVTRLDTVIAVRANGRDIPLAIEVPLESASEDFTMEVEVRIGSAALFRGSAPLLLHVGPRPRKQTPMTLTPVASALALPDTLPVLAAYGDSVLVRGATIFATLDTVAADQPIVWTSLDPVVVAVQGTVPVAMSDGLARLVGQLGTFVDTVRVPVFAEVARVIVLPDSTASPMPLGTTRQYSAQLFDRRGNRITGRPLIWTSSDPAILRIDANGLATAQALGTAVVRVTSGSAVAGLSVRVRALPPVVFTDSAAQLLPTSAVLHARVNPNRVGAEAWFEYSTDTLFVNPQITPIMPLAAGQSAAPVSALLTQLQPRTLYYARARATSAGGTTTGNRIEFWTPGVPRPPQTQPLLQVTTGSTSDITFSSATIAGSLAISGNVIATAWLQWSQDSTLAQATSTPATTFPAGPGQHPLSASLDDLETGGVYYYRAAARNAAGTMFYGSIRNFRTLSGDCSPDPLGGDRSMSLCSPASGARIKTPARSKDPVRRQE